MIHIAEFLNAMGERDMAAEVLNAHNRLECFCTGLDRDLVEARKCQIPEGMALIPADSTEASLQARIDELMLEYCPDEMTTAQMDEWARNQRPVTDDELLAAAQGARNA